MNDKWAAEEGSQARPAAVAGIVTAVVVQAGLAITGIILARSLGPADRGFLALVTVVPFVVWQLGSLGLPLSVTYAIARDSRTLVPVMALIWKATLIQVACLLPLTALFSLVLIQGEREAVFVAAGIALTIVPAHLIHGYLAAVIQGLERPIAYYVLRSLPIAFWLVGLLSLLLADELTLLTSTATYAFSAAISAAITAVYVAREVDAAKRRSKSAPPDTRWMIRFGLRGVLSTTPFVNSYRLDQGIVAIFLSPVALGLYVVAVALTNLPRFIALNIGAMAYPATARQRSLGKARTTLWRYFAIGVVAAGAVAGLIWIAAPTIVPFLFGEEFRDAVDITRVLLVASFVVSAQRMLIDGARGLGYPGLGSISELTVLLTLVAAASLLVPPHGVTGIAWAFVVAAAAGLLVALGGLLFARPREQPDVEREAWEPAPTDAGAAEAELIGPDIDTAWAEDSFKGSGD